ncbi:MAG: phosphodiesterase family [Dehalococcoidia bacterium]|nr:phosphodiesterase family [Dehalococcoidia bacterium]
MKIGLISDTHIPAMGAEPPPQVARAFQGVDLILHAGDIYVKSCIDWLERIAPVKALELWVESVGESFTRVNVPQVIEAEGHSIGLVHELILVSLADEIHPGTIERNFPAGESIPEALEMIFRKPVDIVVCGYTHEAMVETHQGVLIINPGSPTMVKQNMRLGTVAILEVTPNSREVRIIDLAGMAQ